MKGKNLRKLASNETDELKTCNGIKKSWCELLLDIFWLKCLKQKKVEKSALWNFYVFLITKDSTT